MSNTMIKSFAVMAVSIFTLGFLVTTATPTTISLADSTNQATITFEDKSTTKNISICANNLFVSSGSKVNSGSNTVKAYYGNINGAATCDLPVLQKSKVFEITKDLTSGQTLQIIAEGTATLSGVKETIKPVLLSTTNIPGILSQNTVSFKAIANSNAKYKDAICMDEFLIKEDAIGSAKSKVIYSDVPRSFSLDFTRNGAFCTASDSSPKLDIDIKCACDGAKLYEIGFETIKDESNISYKGLTFTTKVLDAPVVPVIPTTPVTPTTPVVPVTPVTPTTPVVPVVPTIPVVPVTPTTPVVPTTPVTPTPKVNVVTPPVVTPVTPTTPVVPAPVATPTPAVTPLIAAQTSTVRSGGNNLLLIAPISVALGLLAYFSMKTKKFQIG
jgi:hypothetical protein